MLNSIRSRVIPALFTTMSSPPSPSAQATGDDGDLLHRNPDLVDDVGSIQRAGDVVDDDSGAQARQTERFGPSQPRGRACHHRDLSG